MSVEYGGVDTSGDVVAIKFLTIARSRLAVIWRKAADEELVLLGAFDIFIKVDGALVRTDDKLIASRDLIDPYGTTP